jgi:hypothetical protein
MERRLPARRDRGDAVKEMELIWYGAYKMGPDRRTRIFHGPERRLTDAELAAEHHAAVLAVYRARVHHDDADWPKRLGEMQAMYRFATHPHYDEVEE